MAADHHWLAEPARPGRAQLGRAGQPLVVAGQPGSAGRSGQQPALAGRARRRLPAARPGRGRPGRQRALRTGGQGRGGRPDRDQLRLRRHHLAVHVRLPGARAAPGRHAERAVGGRPRPGAGRLAGRHRHQQLRPHHGRAVVHPRLRHGDRLRRPQRRPDRTHRRSARRRRLRLAGVPARRAAAAAPDPGRGGDPGGDRRPEGVRHRVRPDQRQLRHQRDREPPVQPAVHPPRSPGRPGRTREPAHAVRPGPADAAGRGRGAPRSTSP